MIQRNTCLLQQFHKWLQISTCLCCVMITLSNLMGFWKRSSHLQRSDLRNWPPPTVCWLVRLIWAEAIRVVIRAGITLNLGLRCEVNFASATWKSAGSFLINLAWLPASASKSSQPRVDKPHTLENQTGLGEGTTGGAWITTTGPLTSVLFLILSGKKQDSMGNTNRYSKEKHV